MMIRRLPLPRLAYCERTGAERPRPGRSGGLGLRRGCAGDAATVTPIAADFPETVSRIQLAIIVIAVLPPGEETERSAFECAHHDS